MRGVKGSAAPAAESPAVRPPVQLTESQKLCMRLVGEGLSSKEIAQATGLAPLTVDTYVKQAVGKIGGANRREAARIFAGLETSQRLGSQSQDLAQPDPAPPETSQDGRRQGLSRRLPPLGGVINNLDARQKTLQILQVAIVGAVVVLAIVLGFAGLLQILR